MFWLNDSKLRKMVNLTSAVFRNNKIFTDFFLQKMHVVLP